MAKKTENSEKTRLLRLPIKLDKEIQARAKQSHRSINGQIIYELDQKPGTIKNGSSF